MKKAVGIAGAGEQLVFPGSIAGFSLLQSAKEDLIILIQGHQIHSFFPSIVLKGVPDDQITGVALMLGQVVGVDQNIASIAGDTGELLLGVEGVEVPCGGVDRCPLLSYTPKESPLLLR